MDRHSEVTRASCRQCSESKGADVLLIYPKNERFHSSRPMRAFFFGSKTTRPDMKRHYSAVESVLKQANVELSLKIGDRLVIGLPKDVVECVEARGGMLLYEMHAMILEGSSQDPELGFFLAHAMATRKPTLFLYTGMKEKDTILQFLDSKCLPASLKVIRYIDDNLEDTIIQFLRSLGQKKFARSRTSSSRSASPNHMKSINDDRRTTKYHLSTFSAIKSKK